MTVDAHSTESTETTRVPEARTARSIAVISAVNNDAVLSFNLMRSPMLSQDHAAIPLVLEHNRPSAGVAYNAALRRTDAEYLVFAHQDVYFPRGWEEKLLSAIRQLDEAGTPWAVLGVWGVRADGSFAGRVWCSGGNQEHAAPITDPTQVRSIDEIVIVLRRSSGLSFDEKLPGFHLYATDIIQQAHTRGLGAFVIDAPVVHNSRANPNPLDKHFFAAYAYLQKKWRDALPLPTCTVPVTRSGWALRKRWLKREVRRLRGKFQAHSRSGSPIAIAQSLGYEFTGEPPLVSVLVSVYNAGRFLLPSIKSLLSQTYRNLEIIIINDGSTDGCMDALDALDDPRIRIIEQANRGKSHALNVALDQIRGEFYAIHDGDDLSHPLRMERQVACFLGNPDVAAVYSGHELLLGERQIAPTFKGKDRNACREDITHFRMPGHDPTGMYRVSLVRDLRYSTDLAIGQGLDYILRVGERHPMLVLPESLYVYRIHAQSNTKRDPERRRKLVQEIMRRACARRGLDYDREFPPATSASGRRNRDSDNNLAAHFIDSVCGMRERGRRREALSTALYCSRLHPLDPHYQKALVYALLPRPLLEKIRNRRARHAL